MFETSVSGCTKNVRVRKFKKSVIRLQFPKHFHPYFPEDWVFTAYKISPFAFAGVHCERSRRPPPADPHAPPFPIGRRFLHVVIVPAEGPDVTAGRAPLCDSPIPGAAHPFLFLADGAGREQHAVYR